jgi:beta-carotene/zeaxanthin 4-ketolase
MSLQPTTQAVTAQPVTAQPIGNPLFFTACRAIDCLSPMPDIPRNNPAWSATIGLGIVALWLFSFVMGCSHLDLGYWILPLIVVRTLCQTGLFIVAHDTMHGSVFDQADRNRWLGSFLLLLYAGLDYDRCRAQHQAHHHQPGEVEDPDFYDGRWWSWVGRFALSYFDRGQTCRTLSAIAWVLLVLWLGLDWPIGNLILVWLLPMVLSAAQLFWVGTYLPHRIPIDGHTNRHRAQSLDIGTIGSFLACYHLGYHWEHHEYPQVPWYQLPQMRSMGSGAESRNLN